MAADNFMWSGTDPGADPHFDPSGSGEPNFTMPRRDGNEPAEPGWHADPHDSAMVRFWDGSSWTSQTRARRTGEPGWYPDPHAPGWRHFWDGECWTGERQRVGSARTASDETPRSGEAQGLTDSSPRSSSGALLLWLLGLGAVIGLVADAGNGGSGEGGFMFGAFVGLFLWTCICHPKVIGAILFFALCGWLIVGLLHLLFGSGGKRNPPAPTYTVPDPLRPGGYVSQQGQRPPTYYS